MPSLRMFQLTRAHLKRQTQLKVFILIKEHEEVPLIANETLGEFQSFDSPSASPIPVNEYVTVDESSFFPKQYTESDIDRAQSGSISTLSHDDKRIRFDVDVSTLKFSLANQRTLLTRLQKS
jgi:hypothetical protein